MITVDPMPRRYYALPATSWAGQLGWPGSAGWSGASLTAMNIPTASSLLDDESIVCVDHVGIAVPDLEAAIAFHTSVLGGSVSHREINTDQGVEEAMISYGTGAQIQLLAPLDAASTIAKFIDRNGPGLQQLAYRVTDVEAVSARLRRAGLRLLFAEPRRGTAGSRINFVHPKDTGGVLVELVEPATAVSE
jgi:methylmalonyl-CoA/ethylmalonyl-CoA epimerase